MNTENLERSAIEQRNQIERTARELFESATPSYNVRRYLGRISIVVSLLGFFSGYMVGTVSFRR